MKETTENLNCQAPALTPVQAAHQTRRLSQPPSRRRANSLPAPALARPSAAPEPDLGRPLGPSSAESASSLPCLAGQGLLSRLQAPRQPSLPSAASRTRKQTGLHAATRGREPGSRGIWAGPDLEEAPLPGSPGRPVTPPAPHTSAPPARGLRASLLLRHLRLL